MGITYHFYRKKVGNAKAVAGLMVGTQQASVDACAVLLVSIKTWCPRMSNGEGHAASLIVTEGKDKPKG